ncbi:MAG: NlpC/P60 family protein [Rhodovibrionaceae bacterium]
MTEHSLDPRLNAFRPDLADWQLEGRVEAARFVEGTPAQVRAGVASLRRRPEDTAPQDSQLLSGEMVTVFEDNAGADGAWAWVQNWSDRYVGYVRAEALTAETAPATHSVKVLRTPVYPEPDIKTPVLDWLTMSGQTAVTGERGRFSELAGSGWVFSAHLAEGDETEPDYVATARHFLGAPYLWGGKESLGLDCSGLVQVALHRAGLRCLRDTPQQENDQSLGQALPPVTAPVYGDLIFWKGHVALALDSETVLHASGGPMLTTIEPLAAIDARARKESGSGITVVRRL